MPAIKLLDFGARLPEDGRMARPRTLAWPVKAYRITLPDTSASPENDLNPFEAVLLRLLEIDGQCSDAELSQATCIPEDFVKGVLLQLQDKGYVDDRNNLRRKASDARKTTEFKAAMIFQELVGGNVLPFVYYDSKPMTKIEQTGTYCKQIMETRERFNQVTASDVLKAVKEQSRHSRAYGEKTRLPNVESIRIKDAGERFHLECPISMRWSDSEFRIGNPFGKGYSLVLESAFLQKLAEDERLEAWMNDWRADLSREHDLESERSAEPFDNSRNKELYPHLIPSLRKNRYGMRSIERIYSSLEWALFYANEMHSPRKAVNLFKLAKAVDTRMLVKNAAEEIGLDVPEKGFLRVNKENLDSYLDETPEMPTALAIAIILAKDDDSHPLRSFAKSRPDAALMLYQIKRERDMRSHGRGRGSQDGPNGRSELFMKEMVSALLPRIAFDGSENTAVVHLDEYADARFEARSKLITRFGYAAFNTELSIMTQDRLVDAECFLDSFSDGDDALPFAGHLYAALQSEISRKAELASIRNMKDRELATAIELRSKELKVNPLPTSLSTVRPHNIRKALQGLDETTLGALVIAYMLTANHDEVSSLLEKDRSFFSDVGEVITVRGHLNEPKYLTASEVEGLRETAYRCIDALMDE